MLRFSVRPTSCTLGIVLSALLLVGCGGEGASEGRWRVEEEALTLERDLFVSEEEDFYFGSIGDVAVDEEGRMYVLDGNAVHVKVLGPAGTLRDTLGRKGEGPGEFQRPAQIVCARGDSLYVLDSRRDRISVFTPSGEFAYGLPVESEGTFPEGLMVPDEQGGFVLSYASFPRPGSEQSGAFTVRRMYVSARPGDTILTAAPRDRHPVQRGEMSVYFTIPFGRGPHAAMGPDGHVHFGRNDRLQVAQYELNGAPPDTLTIPFEPVPVTENEREDALERFRKQDRSMLRDQVPSTKPAFEHLLVDDRGRYWFGRPTADPDSTSLWVANPEAKRAVTATLPGEMQLVTVKDGRAYGRTTTEEGAPAVVRYRVRTDGAASK